MEFDTWFYSQKKYIQILLLVFPVVGWVVEILVRLSIILKEDNIINIGAFAAILLFGWAWVLVLADVVYLVLKNKLLFC